MKSTPVRACLLCGAAGKPLHEGLADDVYGAPGTWSLRRCDACGLDWLDPRPEPGELKRLYKRYFTHACDVLPRFPRSTRARIKALILDSPLWAVVARRPGVFAAVVRALSHVPMLGAIANPAVRALAAEPPGRVLDVGCGSGEFLAVMRALGWRCTGLEPDAAAAQTARERLGIEVVEATLESASLKKESFELITLNHALEHLPDPAAALARCRELLTPRGLVVVITPNTRSLGARELGKRWIHLDVPRHFWLFSLASLETALTRGGFTLEWLTTGAGLAGMTAVGAGRGVLGALLFYVREETRRTLGEPVGEELVAVARKSI